MCRVVYWYNRYMYILIYRYLHVLLCMYTLLYLYSNYLLISLLPVFILQKAKTVHFIKGSQHKSLDPG